MKVILSLPVRAHRLAHGGSWLAIASPLRVVATTDGSVTRELVLGDESEGVAALTTLPDGRLEALTYWDTGRDEDMRRIVSDVYDVTTGRLVRGNFKDRQPDRDTRLRVASEVATRHGVTIASETCEMMLGDRVRVDAIDVSPVAVAIATSGGDVVWERRRDRASVRVPGPVTDLALHPGDSNQLAITRGDRVELLAFGS